jgi:hypothetical protein
MRVHIVVSTITRASNMPQRKDELSLSLFVSGVHLRGGNILMM